MAVQFPQRPQREDGRADAYNPYRSPDADIDTAWNEIEYHQEPFYSIHGRVGRIRFLSYIVLINIAATVISMVLGSIIGTIFFFMPDSTIAMVPLGILWIFNIAVSLYAYFAPSIRRLNDLNRTGWLSLLYLIPLVNIVFFFYLALAGGDEGYNDYGEPAEPPTTLHYILALVFPLLIIAIIGILAAIAIPAYQDYVLRSQMGI